MNASAYKKILGKVPAGVFVFDEKLRILYANDAFARAFAADGAAALLKFRREAKIPLNEFLFCPESGKAEERPACGEGKACAYCSFFKTMKRAAETGTEQTDTVSVTADKGNRTETV